MFVLAGLLPRGALPQYPLLTSHFLPLIAGGTWLLKLCFSEPGAADSYATRCVLFVLI